MIDFIVPGEPQGKARPRVERNRYTGAVHARTPDKTVAYEEFIRWRCPKGEPLIGQIILQIDAVYGIPKSTSKKQAEYMRKGLLFPMKKPDVDNIAKVVMDALNGVVYPDDKNIVELYLRKRYIRDGEFPHVRIRIMEV